MSYPTRNLSKKFQIKGHLVGKMTNVYMPISDDMTKSIETTFSNNINMYLCTRLYDLAIVNSTSDILYQITDSGLVDCDKTTEKEFSSGICITVDNRQLTKMTDRYIMTLLKCCKTDPYIKTELQCNILFLDFLNANKVVHFVFKEIPTIKYLETQKRMNMYVII